MDMYLINVSLTAPVLSHGSPLYPAEQLQYALPCPPLEKHVLKCSHLLIWHGPPSNKS